MKELTKIKGIAYHGTQDLFLNQTDVVDCLLQYGLEMLVVLLSHSLEKPLHLFNIMLLFSIGDHLMNYGSKMFRLMTNIISLSWSYLESSSLETE